MNSFTANLIGYGFAMFVAVLPIWLISNKLWLDLIPIEVPYRQGRPRAWHAPLVGIIERFLYVVALRSSFAGFIGVWIGVKVASQWKGWSQGREVEYIDRRGKIQKHIIEGRQLSNIFMIGNGLSIAYAIVGCKLIGWLTQKQCGYAWKVPAILFVASMVLYGCLALFLERESVVNKNDSDSSSDKK